MSIEKQFFELAGRLDTLISIPNPTQKYVEETLAIIANKSLYIYFFKHLAESKNLPWFYLLRQKGVFEITPEPNDKNETISYPISPIIKYLANIASEIPDEVIEVAENIYFEDPFSMLELVRATRSMQPSYAVRMVPLIIKWIDEGMPIEKDVISLVHHLANEDQWEVALKLVEIILSPKEKRVSEDIKQSPFYSPRAISKSERYYLQAFVEQEIKVFLEHKSLEILSIVQKNLERAFEIEGREVNDLSTIWRPAIEPHEQNIGNEIKDLLVNTAVKVFNFIVGKTPDQGEMILEKFLEHHLSIFRRLAIHTIRENADLWPDLLISLFTDSKYLDDIEVYHEYWMLMNHTFGSLSTSIQENFIDQLLSRLHLESLEDERQYHQQRLYVYRRLCAIKDSLPSDKYRDFLAEMVKEYGELDHPSFLSYSRFMIGEVSPITTEELIEMQPEDILADLKRDFPYHRFDEPSQEGFANELRAAIVSSPEHFAPIASQLVDPDIPHIYTERALRGFRDAWKEDKAFKWEPVLELCKMVSQTSQEISEGNEPPDMEPGYWMATYASARNAVIELLSAGVDRDDHAIPSKFLVAVRDILLTLADDINPSPEYEQEWGPKSPFGVLDLALNVTRGKAVETLLEYALHVARISSKDQQIAEELLPPGSRMEVIVKNKLTEKLDKNKDPSLAVHSLFGKFLPNIHYLDEEWFVAHLEDIFPRQPDMSNYWEAAWDGYLFRSDFFESLYKDMRPNYRYALDQMKLGELGKAGSELSRGRVARHLAMLYNWGIETLEDVQSLIPLFFDVAPDGIRSGFVTGLEAALRKNEPSADSEEWLRAKTLWEVRFRKIGENAEKGGDKADFVKELGAFTGWTPFIPEDEDFRNFYEMIEAAALASENWDAVRLLEFLETVSTDHAEFVVSLLEKLLRQERLPFFLVSNYETIRTILVNGVHSSDSNAKSCAVRVINYFGERGDERYRHLLKLASS